MHEQLSNRVFDFRTKAQMTQEELAQKVSVTRQTIIAIERGNYAPSVTLALKIAAVFKKNIEEIFFFVHKI